MWCETALEPYGQKPAAHHRLLIDRLSDVVAGRIDRLMVLMPPGSAKSTYCSALLPTFWLARRPRDAIIFATHTTAYARRWGRRSRNLLAEFGPLLGVSLTEDEQAADHWSITAGGEYGAFGIGAAVTGRRADLVLIDDPVSGHETADSETARESAWDWYQSDLYTRLKPGGRIVLVMTRWHEDDLGGRLLAAQKAGTGDSWHVLSLPALAGPNDPLGRVLGEPLWPEWESTSALARKRLAVGERSWNALYQQRPFDDTGSIIKRAWWRMWITNAPDDAKLPTGAIALPVPKSPDFIVVSLDTAYTDKEQNDPTACTVWHVVQDNHTGRQTILLRYAWAKRLTFPDLVAEIEATCEHFGLPLVPMRVLVEAKASGLPVVQELRRRRPQLHIFAVNPRGDKVARAHAVTSLLESGTVFALAKWMDGAAPAWNAPAQLVIDEAAAFPTGAHDDLTDTLTAALRHVREMGVELLPEDDPPLPVLGQRAEALY